MREAKKVFPFEFLNRFDEIITYHTLKRQHLYADPRHPDHADPPPRLRCAEPFLLEITPEAKALPGGEGHRRAVRRPTAEATGREGSRHPDQPLHLQRPDPQGRPDHHRLPGRAPSSSRRRPERPTGTSSRLSAPSRRTSGPRTTSASRTTAARRRRWPRRWPRSWPRQERIPTECTRRGKGGGGFARGRRRFFVAHSARTSRMSLQKRHSLLFWRFRSCASCPSSCSPSRLSRSQPRRAPTPSSWAAIPARSSTIPTTVRRSAARSRAWRSAPRARSTRSSTARPARTPTNSSSRSAMTTAPPGRSGMSSTAWVPSTSTRSCRSPTDQRGNGSSSASTRTPATAPSGCGGPRSTWPFPSGSRRAPSSFPTSPGPCRSSGD